MNGSNHWIFRQLAKVNQKSDPYQRPTHIVISNSATKSKSTPICINLLVIHFGLSEVSLFPSTQCHTFNFATAAGEDYTGGSYTATFPAGATTASVSIPITEDAIAEPTEDFSAVLTIPAAAASQGITKGADDTATINILDNDPVEVVFNPTQYNVSEGDGSVTLTLNADKAASFAYTVEVQTQDGTATGNLEC